MLLSSDVPRASAHCLFLQIKFYWNTARPVQVHAVSGRAKVTDSMLENRVHTPQPLIFLKYSIKAPSPPSREDTGELHTTVTLGVTSAETPAPSTLSSDKAGIFHFQQMARTRAADPGPGQLGTCPLSSYVSRRYDQEEITLNLKPVGPPPTTQPSSGLYGLPNGQCQKEVLPRLPGKGRPIPICSSSGMPIIRKASMVSWNMSLSCCPGMVTCPLDRKRYLLYDSSRRSAVRGRGQSSVRARRLQSTL